MSGPGKFEGEPDWVEELWELSLDGSWGDGIPLYDEYYMVMELSDDDKARWPDLSDAYGVILHETSNGFVDAEIYDNKKDYTEAVSELEVMAAKEAAEENGQGGPSIDESDE